MTCSDPEEKDLLTAGWERCFVAEEPRLSEAVDTYRELGFETLLRPVSAADGPCTECLMAEPGRYRVIYIRRRAGTGDEEEEKTMASGSIAVRVMRPEDVPAMVEIDGLASGSPRSDYLQGKASQALDSQHAMVISLVAESAGGVIGFLMGQVYLGEFGIPESVATVDTLGIHPSHQGQGVARVLMEEFLAHAGKAGVERVRTLVDWNQGELLDFFRAMGFAPAASLVLERHV